MGYCYVEFILQDDKKLDRLKRLLDTVMADLKLGSIDNDTRWVGLMNDEELAGFWWPNERQREAASARWGDVPIRIVDRKDNEQKDWDIYSMFSVIGESEYDLIGIRTLSPGLHRLEFNPLAYPFGGTGSLQKLVTAFGAEVRAVDDGTGRETMEGQSTHK